MNDYKKLLKLNQEIQIPSAKIITYPYPSKEGTRTIADLSRSGQDIPAMFFSPAGIVVLYGMAGWAMRGYDGDNEEFRKHLEKFQGDFLNFLQSLGISEEEINQYRPVEEESAENESSGKSGCRKPAKSKGGENEK